MISGILLGLGFIISTVYYVNKLFVSSTKDVLVRFIILVFASLVALFIVDKVIAFKINYCAGAQAIKFLILLIPDDSCQLWYTRPNRSGLPSKAGPISLKNAFFGVRPCALLPKVVLQ
jgi:hypothetical protein